MPNFRLERDRQGGWHENTASTAVAARIPSEIGDGRRTCDQEESGNAADCLVPNIYATDLEGDFVYCRPEDRSRLAWVSVPEGWRGSE